MPEKPTIEPPSQLRAFPTDPDAQRKKRRALSGFIVLALLAVAVVVVLPRMFKHTPEQTDAVQTPVTQPSPAAVQENPVAAEAQELLDTSLKLKARLDNEGAKIWGADRLVTSYEEILGLLTAANSNFDDKRFGQAVQDYKKTIAALKQLEKSRPERTQRAIQAGNKALEKLDEQAAKRHFETALTADNDNTEALQGVQRAEVLPQIAKHIEQGRSHENNGSLDKAREMYESASSLDQDCTAARNHLKRVDALIEERDFKRAVSEAMSAYNRNDVKQAQQALNRAKKIRPNNAAVRDLDRQIAATMRRTELQRLHGLALDYEKSEQWDKALDIYTKALAIDQTAGFAQQGKPRAEKFAALNREIQEYLSSPDDLHSSKHRTHAGNLYEAVAAMSSSGPKLKENAAQLRHLVERYNKPTTIVLQSDDMTDIMIYRVGRMGRFIEHSLQLKPGHYKMRGTRSGYRDTIVEFSVPIDSTGMTVRIVCKEKI